VIAPVRVSVLIAVRVFWGPASPPPAARRLTGSWAMIESAAEAALRIFRQFRQRGCMVVSVRESWLAEREAARRSERITAGLRQVVVRGRRAAARQR